MLLYRAYKMSTKKKGYSFVWKALPIIALMVYLVSYVALSDSFDNVCSK